MSAIGSEDHGGVGISATGSSDMEVSTDRFYNENEDAEYGDSRVGTVILKRSRWVKFFWLFVALCLIAGVGVGVAVSVNSSMVPEEIPANAADMEKTTSTTKAMTTSTNFSTVNAISLNESAVDEESTEIKIDEKDALSMEPLAPSVLHLGEEQERVFQARKISVSLPMFDSGILKGYDHCDDLKNDLAEALSDLANLKIYDFMKNPYQPVYNKGGVFNAANFKGGGGEESYGTNNQSDDVDEADQVKSDGTYVYTVYGEEVLTISTQDGSILSRLRLISDDVVDDSSNNNKQSSGKYHWGGPSKRIDGLLLYHNEDDDGMRTLVAMISELSYFRFGFGSSAATTEVVTMRVSPETGVLTIVDSTIIQGRYMAARMTSVASDVAGDDGVMAVAHLVTSTTVDHFSFTEEIARYAPRFQNMNDTEYVEAAFAHTREILAEHTSRTLEELIPTIYDPTTDCRHVTRLSRMQPIRTDGNDDEDLFNYAGNYNSEGLLKGFVRIVSFDMIAAGAGVGSSHHHIAAAFTPTSYADVYASRDMLFLGGQGFRRDERVGGGGDIWTDYTYITAFELKGATAVPVATGTVLGYTLNQFAMDYYKGHLRIATSTTEDGYWDDETETYKIISESTNQVFVTRVEGDRIVVVGEINNLGVDEQIFAVRFMEDRAFLVTFRWVDPFYTLDMSDPTNPQRRGELKIPGFSNYLHPVDNSYILAVGQDVDEETGISLGLQIALFDVSDFSDPRQVGKYVVPGWSSSESQYDHHAFRYLPQSQKLVLPVSKFSYTVWGDDDAASEDEAFDGFHVYSIAPPANELSKNGTTNTMTEPISMDFIVSHYDSELAHSRNCYGQANLPSRSMLFRGNNLMTLKGHSALGHDLRSGNILYQVDMDPDDNLPLQESNTTTNRECYGWFF